MINDVVIVNNELVFRFCKTASALNALSNEIRILKLVRTRLSLKIPTPTQELSDLVIYPYLSGQPISREILFGLDENAQGDIAAQLGTFLKELHGIPIDSLDWEIPLSPAPTRRDDWLDLQARIKKRVYPFLTSLQIIWCDHLFTDALDDVTFFKYNPVIIHGDLAGYHILLDEARKHISAILDFGVSGLGDPALDIANLITHFGETFISKIRLHYPPYDGLINRARFYAKSIELQWSLYGIETGETFWFTAHIGNAKDLLE